MKTWVTEPAYEASTAELTVDFVDQDGNAFTPTALTWTLLDGSGAVVNSREDVSITPASTVSVVLSGDDLAMNDETLEKEVRSLLFEGTYNHGAYAGLPVVRELFFFLINQKGA